MKVKGWEKIHQANSAHDEGAAESLSQGADLVEVPPSSLPGWKTSNENFRVIKAYRP